MLHIIWTILKIIGIILAALLGLLLAIILVLLFVPIGYDARIDNRKNILVKVNGWWLFHALHVSFYMDGIPSEEKGNAPIIKVRIFGVPILDTSKKKEEKTVVTKTKVTQENVPERAGKEAPEGKDTAVEQAKTEPQLTVQEVSTKEEHVEKNLAKESVPTKEVSKKQQEDKPVVKEAPLKAEIKRKESGKTKTKKKTSVKAKEVKAKVSISNRIRNLVDTIKKKLQNIEDTKRKLEEKIGLLKCFIQNEENVNGIKKIFHSIKRILKHLLPNKIKGHVKFGLDDPCATGQALGVLAMFYTYYGKSLVIEPDFTKQVIEGDVYLKGYIHVFTLCIIGIKLLIDANFRKLIKNFKKLKEEL